ncbi:sensor domain-containing diguanylate cyclase [Microvirga lotononidis]|uniref:diguanylate cyclase n=1 Tax=Microvirga lotononidis TaxID=864069 RepID=I4YW36_9HYPH|nr:sensor domain-containing diguanylate cyclase [Microvirga lotononidis]EIM28178.1 diguanylate cyclase (GGDEF) domain-containing protein [Microvirga lotononidis]WQO27723.1 sensor domain-containing diguanylate cyclase [Microvirga lotononidis]
MLDSKTERSAVPSSSEFADDAEMFELAPVSLWLEDYSELKELFAQWREAGVTSLRDYLLEDTARVATCSSLIRVIKVNRKTLSLFEAEDLSQLVGNLDRIFRNDMLKTHIEELVQLWDGHTEFFGNTVNYTLSGKRLDIQLKGSVLPGHDARWDRVLIAIEDVTERETARRQLAASESYARGLFEHSPVSLWVEDFSSVKHLLDDVRRQGITDFRVFTDVHPEFVTRCMSEIRVIDVNRHTLELFSAPDKQTLLMRLGDVFRDEMREHFREQLIDLWNGKIFQQREVVNYSLAGDELHLHLQFSVLPGYEKDWSLVQVALTDITARKRAEAYLEYLGKHDVLTKLYNRSFYVDELNRLERKGPFPVSVVIIDLNGLKAANDQLGHAAGDALLRRAGEVLNKAVDRPSCAARIGGDEFALLMPGTDERDAKVVVEAIETLLEVNNQFYTGLPLRFAMGTATSQPGERLEAVVKRADLLMYEAKRAYYAAVAG